MSQRTPRLQQIKHITVTENYNDHLLFIYCTIYMFEPKANLRYARG